MEGVAGAGGVANGDWKRRRFEHLGPAPNLGHGAALSERHHGRPPSARRQHLEPLPCGAPPQEIGQRAGNDRKIREAQERVERRYRRVDIEHHRHPGLASPPPPPPARPRGPPHPSSKARAAVARRRSSLAWRADAPGDRARGGRSVRRRSDRTRISAWRVRPPATRRASPAIHPRRLEWRERAPRCRIFAERAGPGRAPTQAAPAPTTAVAICPPGCSGRSCGGGPANSPGCARQTRSSEICPTP